MCDKGWNARRLPSQHSLKSKINTIDDIIFILLVPKDVPSRGADVVLVSTVPPHTHTHTRVSQEKFHLCCPGDERIVLSVGRQLWNSEAPDPPPPPQAWSIWFVPGQLAGKGAGLGEELPDFSVNVAKEVHVGSSAVQAFILHQELTEQHLRFVFLPHDLELGRRNISEFFLFAAGAAVLNVVRAFVHQRETYFRLHLKLTFMEPGLFSSRLLMMPLTFFESGLSRTGRAD